MGQRRVPGQNSSGREHRPHHISSIAHLFFDEEGGPENPDCLQIELVVGHAGSGPLGAWTCAGLVRSLAGESIFLGESSVLPWSVTSYLKESELLPLDLKDPGTRFLSGSSVDYLFWQVVDPSFDLDHPSDPSADSPGRPRVIIRNLGALNSQHLGELETALLVANSTGATLPGCDTLVWCFTPQEALSLGGAYTLGRALALLRPDRVEIMVVDESWLNPSVPASPPSQPDVMDRCLQLVETVACETLVSFNHALARSNPESGLVENIFNAIAGRALQSAVSNSD